MDIESSADFNIFSDCDYDSESNETEVESRKNLPTHQTNNNDEIIIKREMSSITVEDEEESTEAWSIEDDSLFYPRGITNFSILNVDKFAVLIWSDFFLINFIIAKNAASKKTKTTRARLNIPSGEEVKDVLILDCNTLLLLTSGSINYFSSLRSMYKLPWLDNVCCFSKATRGFSCIRLLHDQGSDLVLEVYEDTINMGKMATAPIRHRYNITFDERNLFNCRWEDEHFVLLRLSIDEDNIDFLENLTRHACDLKNKSDLYLFAVSGNVFVLIADSKYDQDYSIEMLFSYASNVALMKIDCLRKLCLIFLQCGSIDIWFMSSNRQSLRHQMYYTGAEYVSYTYSTINCAFYFSDCSQVVQIKFDYLSESDTVDILESHKSISGIYACTWIETLQCLLCLDCNNIFHHLTFDSTTANSAKKQKIDRLATETKLTTAEDYEKFNTLYELTPSRVSDLAQKAHVIQQLRNMPQELYHSIEQEFVKQQLLAVIEKRRFYSKLLVGLLEYRKNIPEGALINTVPLYVDENFKFSSCDFLALIYLKFPENEIFQNTLWQFHLQYADRSFTIPIPSLLLKERLCLIMPLQRTKDNILELLPRIQLNLYTGISHGSNFVAIQIPISLIDNSNTFAELFGPVSKQPENVVPSCNLNTILERFKRQKTKYQPVEITHILSIPGDLNLSVIFKKFSLSDKLESNEKSFEINFLNSKVSGSFENGNVVQIKSRDAVALFYLKMYLRYFFNEKQKSNNRQDDVNYQQIILRHQCAIEGFYGTLSKSTEKLCPDADLNTNKLDTLKQLYNKIRKELITINL